MSKLDDWEKDEQTGKFSVLAAIVTGIVSIGAIGKKVLDKSMAKSMDEAQRRADERTYNKAHPIKRIFMEKPEEPER